MAQHDGHSINIVIGHQPPNPPARKLKKKLGKNARHTSPTTGGDNPETKAISGELQNRLRARDKRRISF
jgi:hypothetical protein